jgi:precorrin-2 dehydrogenase/sirohydrochlorin ferrochelatase
MSFFPLFLNLENKKILIVGGGKIAYDKASRLLPFTKNITIQSIDFSPKLLELAKDNLLEIKKSSYKKGDINGFDIVITAVNDINLQINIYLESRNSRIFVNSVDLKEYSDFIFPSYIKKDDLIISFSTSGISPAISKHLKKHILSSLPKDIESFIKRMKKLRETLPKGKARMVYFDKLAKNFFNTKA